MATIVTVCTGNICRSPAAELLLREYLGDAITVTSAGTHAMVGWDIPQPMLTALFRAGVDGHDHLGQQLTSELASEADIVLAMTSRHREWIVSLSPRLLNRTFLLAEVAGAARARMPLPGDTPEARLAHVAAAVAARRGETALEDTADVPDPYGHDQDTYDECFAMIKAACRDIADWLADVPVAPPAD